MALSKLLPITIINADASQIYHDLQIVSARPSSQDEAAVPHKLFGTIDGAFACSAADWAKRAKREIELAQAAGRLPVLVGGTGLYVRTLLEGIAPVPEIDPECRKIVRSMPVNTAHDALSAHDYDAAHRLSPNDKTRVARALEVVLSTGRTLADWQQEKGGGIGDQVRLFPMILLPPRDWLFSRCDARFEAMLSGGGVDEVRALLARGLDPALPVMRAIGVREIAQIIADPESLEDAKAAAQQATRQFAKRQFTWFRNQSPPAWERIDVKLNNDAIDNLVIKLRNMALTSYFIASSGRRLQILHCKVIGRRAVRRHSWKEIRNATGTVRSRYSR
jgi:tRNA dimethylallyltransferase